VTIVSGSNLLGVSFPDDWLRSKIGRITTKVGSGATPKGGASVYQATGMPLIRSLNVHNEGFRSYNLAFINDDHARQLEYASVEAGDVLLNITGASILRSAIVPAEVTPARVNQHVSIMRPDTNQVLPGYLHAWLISPVMYSYMYSQSVGSTREAITKEQILQLPIVFPTLEKQRAIVGFLDAKTAEIDGLVGKLERQVELLERYRRELIARTVTRGLNPDVPLRNSGIEWIGKIPEHWAIERLQWHASQVSVDNDPFVTDQILSLVKDVGVMPFEERGLKGNKAKTDLSAYKVAFPGTIVLNSMNVIIGSVGISNYLGLVSPVYYVFKNKPNTSLGFLNYVFRTRAFQKELRKYANGILEIRLRVSTSAVLKRMLAFPPLEEQRAIVDYLDQKMSEIDSTVSGIRKQIELLGKYRKQAINDAVTGKVRVGGEA